MNVATRTNAFMQTRVEMYPWSYPGVVSTGSGQSYYAAPILDGQDSFRYILVCVGQECNLDQVYPAYVLKSNLYRLS